MRIRTALCLFILTTSIASAGELTPEEAQSVLKQLAQIREKQPAATADFTEEKVTHLLNKPLISEGTVAFEAPNKFRREVKGNNPSLSVNNGKTMWVYYPVFKQAEHYTIGQRSFFDDSMSALTAGLNFENIQEYYNFKAFKESGGYQFQLSPKNQKLRRIVDHAVIWLDNDFKVQKAELFLPKGDHLVTTYKNVRRVALPASTFEFTPPSDTNISYPLGK